MGGKGDVTHSHTVNQVAYEEHECNYSRMSYHMLVPLPYVLQFNCPVFASCIALHTL